MFVELTHSDGQKVNLVASKISAIQFAQNGAVVWLDDGRTTWPVTETPEQVKKMVQEVILAFEKEKLRLENNVLGPRI